MNLRSLSAMVTKRRLLIISIVAATLVVHTPPQRLQSWNVDLPVVHLIRSIIFFLSIGLLLYITAKPAIQFFVKTRLERSYGSIALDSLKVFAVTSLLVFPSTLGIMGVGYAYMSIAPFIFVDGSDQLYQRLLMPVFAHILHLKGPVLYHVFSLLVALGTIFLLQIFFLKRKIILTTFEYVSIATSSFLIQQFQSPGYTESLAFVFILLLLIIDFDETARVAVFALCIYAHEASILLLCAISFVFFSKREIGWLVILGAAYGFIMLTSYGFDTERILAVRTVGNRSAMEWIINYPVRELLGILWSFKVLWYFIVAALYKMKNERMNIVLLLLPGVILTLFAVDTTRMAGFGFAALIFSILYIKEHNLLTAGQFKLVCSVNICVPAVYVGVNAGIVYFDGLYQLLQFGVFLQ